MGPGILDGPGTLEHTIINYFRVSRYSRGCIIKGPGVLVSPVINRPGVAGAVLQTASTLIN